MEKGGSKMTLLMLCIIAYIIGIVTGIIAHTSYCRRNAKGAVIMDVPNDPNEQPYMVLELTELPEKLLTRKYVTFNISHK